MPSALIPFWGIEISSKVPMTLNASAKATDELYSSRFLPATKVLRRNGVPWLTDFLWHSMRHSAMV
jgi:hypothetical protein